MIRPSDQPLMWTEDFDDVVESFSQGFQADLQEILGESYRARPKSDIPDLFIKNSGDASRESEYRSRE